LSNVSVTDDQGVAVSFVDGDADGDQVLDLNETWTYEATGTAGTGDYSNIGTATGDFTDDLGNTETATATDPSSYFGISTAGQITPTGTTCDQYINGTAQDFEDFYASQGGVIQYNDNNKAPGVINSTNPGVFFYYTGGDGDFAADANNDGLLDAFGVNIDQTNNLNRDDLLFGTVKNDVKLYGVVDANGSGSLNAGDTCQQIQLTDSNSTLSVFKGDVNLQFNPVNIPDQNFEWYVLGVKYDTNTIKGALVTS
jgi:hypothetical protein